jgi:hypothetical protein
MSNLVYSALEEELGESVPVVGMALRAVRSLAQH